MSTTADLDAVRSARRVGAIRKWAANAGVIAVVVGLAAVAWFSPLLHVDAVTAEGGEIVDAEEVRELVEERTAGTPLPQVRTGALAEALEEEYPAAASIEVSYAGPRSLHVVVVDREPVIAVIKGRTATRYDTHGMSIDEVPAAGIDIPVLDARGGTDPAIAARDGAQLLTEIDGILPAPVTLLIAQGPGTFLAHVEVEEETAEVVFGSADEAVRKAEVAGILLNEGHTHIDVSVPEVPSAR